MKFGQKNRHRDNDDKEVCCFQYLYSQYVSLYDGLPGYGVATADCSCAQPAKYLQGGKITCIHNLKISYYKHTDGFILDNLGLLRVNYS